MHLNTRIWRNKLQHFCRVLAIFDILLAIQQQADSNKIVTSAKMLTHYRNRFGDNRFRLTNITSIRGLRRNRPFDCGSLYNIKVENDTTTQYKKHRRKQAEASYVGIKGVIPDDDIIMLRTWRKPWHIDFSFKLLHAIQVLPQLLSTRTDAQPESKGSLLNRAKSLRRKTETSDNDFQWNC